MDMTTSYYLLHINYFPWICVCVLPYANVVWSKWPFQIGSSGGEGTVYAYFFNCRHKIQAFERIQHFALLDTAWGWKCSSFSLNFVSVCVISFFFFCLPAEAKLKEANCEWCRHLNISTCSDHISFPFIRCAEEQTFFLLLGLL